MIKQILCSMVVCLLLIAGCTKEIPEQTAQEQIQRLNKSGIVLSENAVELLTLFLNKYPVLIQTCLEADITSDGQNELIVIHSSQEEKNKMSLCVLKQDNAGLFRSNVLPAPVENQKITTRDIDGKPPLEFIIMGSKGIYSGFAIYRMLDGVLINIFDDGMDDCC